ncbi:MAG: hypothetical protein AB1305_03720 [Candidatus Hadarchaeota archaeon]
MAKSLVKPVIVLVVIIVVAGAVAALKPWEWINQSGAARFYSRTYFYLTKTEDNNPLENVIISLPDPHVENQLLNNYIKDAYWVLSASTDNGVVVETQGLAVLRLVPPRTSELKMEGMGHEITFVGPKFSFDQVDRLYIGEILEIQLWWEIPADMANRLTLKYNAAGYPTHAAVYSTLTKNVSGQFFAGLYKLNSDNTIAQKVEEFSGAIENEPSNQLVWWGLGQV